MNKHHNSIKSFEETENIPSEIYYHYTSLEALYSIVESKTFRLTSLISSNDKKELYYKPENFISDFKKIHNSETNEDTKKCLQLIQKSIDTNEKEFFNICKKKAVPYALCLSNKKDNLTHWDRYASGCTGVCIGFNISSLKVQIQRMASNSFGGALYDVSKVIYDKNEKEKYIRNGIMRILNGFLEESDICKEIIEKQCYLYAATVYKQLKIFLKNSSFVDEDEIRLYHDATSIKETLDLIELMSPDIDKKMYQNIKKHFEDLVEQLHLGKENFLLTKKGIRSYCELCLDKVWGSGTITEIILGPMCIQNKMELRKFLKANGLEGTKVSISKVPIR